jgi:alpha-D-xyloside xylohydrolase
VMDEPEDKNTFNISDEYLIGSSLLAAPLMAGEIQRSIYLPEGTWYDFNTNQKFQGGKTYTIQPALDQIPLFVKAGTILPLAKPLENISANSQFDITCYVYGDQTTQTSLFEDDGYTFDYEKGMYNTVYLSWKDHKGSVTRKGDYKGALYHIIGWQLIQ